MKQWPFYCLLITTFGMAGLEKIFAAHVPDWFLLQFRGTPLDLFPGSLELGFIIITVLETSTATILLIGMGYQKFQPKTKSTQRLLTLGLTLAQTTFLLLGFGQRLSHKYDEAANLFFYAILTFIAGFVTQELAPYRAVGNVKN